MGPITAAVYGAVVAAPPTSSTKCRTVDDDVNVTASMVPARSASVSWPPRPGAATVRYTGITSTSAPSARSPSGALTSEGYFDNIGQTRRQGIEINTAGEVGRVSWFVNYSFLDATFRQDLLLQSPNNPAAEAGEIRVRPGDRLPLLPRHLLQAGFDFRFSQRFGFGAGLGASSGFHLRGDEGNAGDEIGRYVVVGLRGDYRVSDRLRLFLNIDNIFDRDYESFGLFGEPDEVLGDAFEDSRFLSPAAPRAAWLGLQLYLRSAGCDTVARCDR
jgi:outer membrane receptor protein involved in Fe transport